MENTEVPKKVTRNSIKNFDDQKKKEIIDYKYLHGNKKTMEEFNISNHILHKIRIWYVEDIKTRNAVV